jgi:hypothetical protein
MDLMHPYERLPLFTAGLVLAVWLIACHGLALAKPAMVQGFLVKFPRNQLIGQIILGIGLAWFFLLVGDHTSTTTLNALAMDLGEFNGVKPTLRILVPVSLILVSISVKDFLAVRALGLLGLMAASPLLEAAFLKDPASRLLVAVFAYVMLTVSLFLVGMPYLLRDFIGWATASRARWTGLSAAGLAYGVAVLGSALAFWRGY